MVRRLRRGQPSNRGSRSSGPSRCSIRRRAGRWHPLEPAPDDLLTGAFHDAGSDRQSALPKEIAPHSISVGFEAADAGRNGLVTAAVRLRVSDGEIDPPAVQLRPDPLHPRLPFARVRSEGADRGGRAIKGMELVEGEGRFNADEDLLAYVPDPGGQRSPMPGLCGPPTARCR